MSLGGLLWGLLFLLVVIVVLVTIKNACDNIGKIAKAQDALLRELVEIKEMLKNNPRQQG